MSFITRKKFGRTASCKRTSSDIPVQGGLAITPAQMQRMAEKGIPVSSQNLDGCFYDGDTRPSWDVPLDMQRGIDVAQMWQERKDIAAKLRSAPRVEDKNV